MAKNIYAANHHTTSCIAINGVYVSET